MLTIEYAPDGILFLSADGQLTVSDYAYGVEQVALLQARTSWSGGLLIEIGPAFTGWSVGALWQHSLPGGAPVPRPRRVAVIGDDRRRGWSDEAIGFAPAVAVRFFDRHERASAACWVREQDDVGAPD